VRAFKLNNKVLNIVKFVFDFQLQLFFAPLVHGNVEVKPFQLIHYNSGLESLVKNWHQVKFVVLCLALARESALDLPSHVVCGDNAVDARDDPLTVVIF